MRILLGSANLSVIDRWQGLLGQENQLEQATNIETLQALIPNRQFDIILLHRLMVDMATCLLLRKLAPACKIFLLSDQPSEEEGMAFLKLGIVGYGNTYIAPKRLSEAIRIIAGGGVWLGQKIIQQLILKAYVSEQEHHEQQLEQKLKALTPTEHKVAGLVARGQTNLEIAADLNMAERTVKAHLTAIYEKLSVSNRLSLALLINNPGKG